MQSLYDEGKNYNLVILKPGYSMKDKGYDYERTDLLIDPIRVTGPHVEEEMERIYDMYPNAVALLENIDDPEQKMFMQEEDD